MLARLLREWYCPKIGKGAKWVLRRDPTGAGELWTQPVRMYEPHQSVLQRYHDDLVAGFVAGPGLYLRATRRVVQE